MNIIYFCSNQLRQKIKMLRLSDKSLKYNTRQTSLCSQILTFRRLGIYCLPLGPYIFILIFSPGLDNIANRQLQSIGVYSLDMACKQEKETFSLKKIE